VAGGFASDGSVLSSAELYNPATGTWATTGSMNVAPEGHTATLLANGRVLIAGVGNNTGGSLYTAYTAELYDPGTGTWTMTGSAVLYPGFGGVGWLLFTGEALVPSPQSCGNPFARVF